MGTVILDSTLGSDTPHAAVRRMDLATRPVPTQEVEPSAADRGPGHGAGDSGAGVPATTGPATGSGARKA